mmetsp:Transcript_26558/g.62038  ORF Transcript_26558/g.62038 Transcript_26558/m.62038 type:complete len:447 (+) Transcript_26558:46-1386(+)|eukprot:CAMPEP_0178410972 /NCGR_PEP_ID=MMETSP0689_2-20121128/21257_1 /TAXON_ID=160604 /ORGANISM="Amphidinium massartii, Strain CS-259" /LENGTH=446 /DNA_ID=CAMNT_0020032169 /DNA_START=46 /DNA_END=1386 /DNA_ORIENTATION=+
MKGLSRLPQRVPCLATFQRNLAGQTFSATTFQTAGVDALQSQALRVPAFCQCRSTVTVSGSIESTQQFHAGLCGPSLSGRARTNARQMPPSLKDVQMWADSQAVVSHGHSRASVQDAPSRTQRIFKGLSEKRAPDGWVVECESHAGRKGPGSLNQDAFSYTHLSNGWLICLTCDGHGAKGEVVAETVSKVLPLLLSNALAEKEPEEALRYAFLESQRHLDEHLQSTQERSGTTVAACLIHAETKRAFVAHAGDSRVVLGDLARGMPVFCTVEHKAHDPVEQARLERAGAHVAIKRFDDGAVLSRVFDPRTKNPGLAMSRSLGDGSLKRVGVTADPEIADVSGHWRQATKPVMLLASDGVIDAMTATEVITRIADAQRSSWNDVELPEKLQAVCGEARRLWMESEPDYIDDCTVVVCAPQESFVGRRATVPRPHRAHERARVEQCSQ